MARTPGAGARRGFVGRARELERLRAVLDGSRDGRAGALLVVGDAGVGKTRLVARACAEWPDDDVLVEVACLPLSTARVPLLPLRTALRRLPAELGAPTPSAGPDGGVGVGDLDEWVDHICTGGRSVLLVVDDLQWADEGTLDALTYLLAGPADRRLALLMTLRRGEVGSGHPLRRWLADARRMPCFGELALSAFQREDTRDLLAAVLGTPAHESLVNDVQARSGGNPYLSRLLMEGVAPDARHLPPGLPESLADAVLSPWRRLRPEARALVLAIALGGEAAGGRALDRAVQLAGVPGGEVPALLEEAVEVGVLDLSPDGGHWFHHPLQAEVLEARLAPQERRSLHAALARACEADLAHEAGASSAARLAATSAVADHHSRAGDHVAAFRWTRRAADLAEELDDDAAALALTRHLVELRDRVADLCGTEGMGGIAGTAGVDDLSRTLLLSRLRTVAARLGDHESEFGAVEGLVAELDEATDPLSVAELLVRHEHLRFSTGRGFLRVEPLRYAADLSRPRPDSWQHGYALAELAHASLWADEPDAQDAVAAAVARADATGDARVTAYAYAAAAMGAVFAQRPGSPQLAARGVEAAAQARDWWGFVHASLWEANGSATSGTKQWASCVEPRRRQLEALGGPHPYLAWLSATEAGSLLGSGDWRGCTERLRVALGSDPGTAADVAARLTAARLAVRQGRQREAEAHLARAEELFADTTDFLAFEFDAVRAMVRLGAGDPAGAHEAAMTGALSPGVPPTLCEWLCPLAARALADLAQAAREEGRAVTGEIDRLDDLVRRFPHVIADSAFLSPVYVGQLQALDALYEAEVARARHDDDEAQRWRRAADLLDGVWPWDAAYATFRAGEAALVGGGRRRDEAAALLRRARSLAEELGAEPVLREVAELARSARIPLEGVGRARAASPADERLLGLTDREHEVLDHVVAGRTYGEIATALFVSEKTVSSHISNLLRKTGTANRHDLARLARHREARTRPAE